MRTIKLLKKARFTKENTVQEVSLPHTWNAIDGQDGGGDYYRGVCTYEIELPDPISGKRQFIQFDGANHLSEVFCNDRQVGEHRGGFSTFRFEITDFLKEHNNFLTVKVNNVAPNVYPQQADFTFFGGLYRDVSFIEVEQAHISLMTEGTDGVFVTPKADGTTRADIFVSDAAGCMVEVTFGRKGTEEIAAKEAKEIKENGTQQISFQTVLENVEKWNGVDAPVLYEAKVLLKKGGAVKDMVTVSYGYREFSVEWETGFRLNRMDYPLHGVSRHQDRQDMGWALTEQEHIEDMQIIRKMGANAVRLAHYQHSQTFYDLCDEEGMVVWAEIPFISTFIEGKEARENTLSQLRELIAQNYNHPSICFWGISNEITIGKESEELEENLQELQRLAKSMDSSRLTTMAHLGTLEPDSIQCRISDIMGYNIYCGWYTGLASENGELLDRLHKTLPGRPLALSEYGADALTKWHSANPKNHDYTEEYQSYYHEELLKTFATRPWLWGTFVWNMFDFAADSRDEGGSKGRNNKGLVTYDRKIYKDAFYIYQAYWSSEPMVHICGKRFKNRGPKERDVKVYTNCERVTLLINGEETETKAATDHVCIFQNIMLEQGENKIEALTENGILDIVNLNGVPEADKSYIMPEEEIVAGNWFDEETGETLTMEYPEGYYSIRDTLGDIMKNPEAAAVFRRLQEMVQAQRQSPANETDSADTGKGKSEEDAQMVKNLGFIPLYRLMKLGNIQSDPGTLIRINRELNKIRKKNTVITSALE